MYQAPKEVNDAVAWTYLTRVLRLAQDRGITVKVSPVPERDDAATYRGYVVLELCMPPVEPEPASCFFSTPATPRNAVWQAWRHLTGA